MLVFLFIYEKRESNKRGTKEQNKNTKVTEYESDKTQLNADQLHVF